MYQQVIDQRKKSSYTVFQRESYLFNFETDHIEQIQYQWKEKGQTALNRVDYNPEFWKNFHQNN
ncbi:MAG: hypothetical protein ACPGRE_01730 [Flavobacteriaceae bacterium]